MKKQKKDKLHNLFEKPSYKKAYLAGVMSAKRGEHKSRNPYSMERPVMQSYWFAGFNDWVLGNLPEEFIKELQGETEDNE